MRERCGASDFHGRRSWCGGRWLRWVGRWRRRPMRSRRIRRKSGRRDAPRVLRRGVGVLRVQRSGGGDPVVRAAGGGDRPGRAPGRWDGEHFRGRETRAYGIAARRKQLSVPQAAQRSRYRAGGRRRGRRIPGPAGGGSAGGGGLRTGDRVLPVRRGWAGGGPAGPAGALARGADRTRPEGVRIRAPARAAGGRDAGRRVRGTDRPDGRRARQYISERRGGLATGGTGNASDIVTVFYEWHRDRILLPPRAETGGRLPPSVRRFFIWGQNPTAETPREGGELTRG